MIRYNLQLFAKDGPGGEKTEPASEKKLSDARKEGNVAKSKEIGNAVTLIFSFYFLKFTIGSIGENIMELYTIMYERIPTYASDASEITVKTTTIILSGIFQKMIMIILPFLLAGFLISFIMDFVQVKWKVTAKPLQPKLSKISPMKGIKRIFSKQSLINLLKSVGIVAICIGVFLSELSDFADMLFNLYDLSILEAIEAIGDFIFDIAIKISIIYLIIGFADFAFQKWKFKEDMKMTKQEVKDEYKNQEGDPKVKSQQRARMRQASQRRMMQQLPKADVVITNPTHFAVALMYNTEIADAPLVIAKGEDYLAQKIKEKAREHKIEIVENKPLARALYQSVEVGEEVPEELYQAVAEVLAYVYNLKNKKVN
jgi:flagellar biosynthetic protein FlhB